MAYRKSSENITSRSICAYLCIAIHSFVRSFVVRAIVWYYIEPAQTQGSTATDTLDAIRRTVRYMEDDIHGRNVHDLSESILAECTNKEDLCSYWAVIGGE